jgi:hypothetical protein
MTGPRDQADDARLLGELGAALGPDPSPAGLVARAEGLLAFAEVDRELAELLDASAAEPVGVRGPGDVAGALVFEVGGGSVSVEVTVTGDRVDGQVLAGEPTEVVLERVSGPAHPCPVDELGRFTFSGVVPGPGRLRLRGGSARPVTTDWFLI